MKKVLYHISWTEDRFDASSEARVIKDLLNGFVSLLWYIEPVGPLRVERVVGPTEAIFSMEVLDDQQAERVNLWLNDLLGRTGLLSLAGIERFNLVLGKEEQP